MKLLYSLFCFTISLVVSGQIHGQSRAHRASKFAIIDPVYNFEEVMPLQRTQKKFNWLYGQGELECYRLEVLQKRKDSAKLNVGYTGDFHVPYKKATFSLKADQPLKLPEFKFKAVGGGEVFVNDELVAEFGNSPNVHTVKVINKEGVKSLRISLESLNGLPTLLPLGLDQLSVLKWYWRGPDGPRKEAKEYASNFETPPHLLEDPSVKLLPVNNNSGVLDFGRELIGHVYVKSNVTPVIRAGESEAEALAVGHEEQSSALFMVKKGLWRTRTPVAFRFIHVEQGEVDSVWTEAIFHPEKYKGAFACSDSLLTRIWMNAAYTLRLCMQDFLLDGIKRDRLPWAGDLAMSSLADAYCFGDGELIEKSLVAIGQAGIANKDINGIVDFSLWWLIAHEQYQKYFDNKGYLKSQWPLIKSILNVLSKQVDNKGFLVPRKGTRLFVDWVKQEKWATLQVLWWWAEKSAWQLALKAGNRNAANYWKALQTRTKTSIYNELWNDQKGYFYAKDSLSQLTRHQNFLAIVSGLVSNDDKKKSIQKYLMDSVALPVGTPYMKGFEMMGLAETGSVETMIDEVKAYWGGMIQKGATSFWEAYSPRELGSARYRFYNRPFGKSLCHAWSSGPTAFLPLEILGIRPLKDGWKEFQVKPNLGVLSWAAASVPTPMGEIRVSADKGKVKIYIPAGTTLRFEGEAIAGSKIYKTELSSKY